MNKCKGCGADIIWIKTKNNKIMPCDSVKTTVVTEQGETIIGHIPHWATCPKSKEFKEKNNGIYKIKSKWNSARNVL